MENATELESDGPFLKSRFEFDTDASHRKDPVSSNCAPQAVQQTAWRRASAAKPYAADLLLIRSAVPVLQEALNIVQVSDNLVFHGFRLPAGILGDPLGLGPELRNDAGRQRMRVKDQRGGLVDGLRDPARGRALRGMTLLPSGFFRLPGRGPAPACAACGTARGGSCFGTSE